MEVQNIEVLTHKGEIMLMKLKNGDTYFNPKYLIRMEIVNSSSPTQFLVHLTLQGGMTSCINSEWFPDKKDAEKYMDEIAKEINKAEGFI